MFNQPRGICVDFEGNVIVCDTDNHKIRKIGRNGIVSTIAGTTKGYCDGNVKDVKFDHPWGMCIDDDGNIYIADGSNLIRKMILSDNGKIAHQHSKAFESRNLKKEMRELKQQFSDLQKEMNQQLDSKLGKHLEKKIDQQENSQKFMNLEKIEEINFLKTSIMKLNDNGSKFEKQMNQILKLNDNVS
uniref:SMP-30/Gluconolactonase/LRE-like region domain-containing protein n=1 Tax=Arcella intermedia TaxID=1963864 RepID=A0A6B2LJV2_9EUKA